MVNLLLAALLAVMQGPQVSATVDRTDALVGDVITLSIRVEASGEEPIRVVNPILSGLEIRGSREATQVRIVEGRARRTFTRALRLVASRPGTATIGPVLVRQGDQVVQTASIMITVVAPAPGIAQMLSPGIRAMVDTIQPALNETAVIVDVRAIPDSVVLGSQLDLVTMAWFPRDIRAQLRAPPTLSPPEVEGVWSYRQTTPTGIVVSRRVGDRWYDLFLSHQILFPLTAGQMRVGPATVSYVLPLTYSFLSRELQHETQSEPLDIAVSPQPAAGRPPGFVGAAGSSITLELQVTPTELRPGGAATATVTLEGAGNVALWPEPHVRWPAAVRVYPGDVTVELTLREGEIGGRKEFTYLLVPDSVGTHVIPGITYPYFDPVAGRYEEAVAPGVQLVAPLGSGPVAARPAPPPLLPPNAAQRWSRPLDRLPLGVWLVIAAVMPLSALLVRFARRRPRTRVRTQPAPPGSAGELERLDHEFRRALQRLVPDATRRAGPGLAAALRAAGLDPSLAAHALRVRDQLQRAVFGPTGVTDPEELAAEVHEVLRALSWDAQSSSRRRLVPLAGVALLVLASAAAVGAGAQQGAPERLYETGAIRAAADSFLQRVAADPSVAAHWFNLGNAFYRLGQDGRARVAWTRAARIAPREPAIRRALGLLPVDRLTSDLTRVRPISFGEAALIAAVLWVGGWLLITFSRVRRIGWALAGAALLVGTAAAGIRSEQRRPVAVVLSADVPLREAPFGSARPSRMLIAGSAVRVERRHGPWMLVRRGDTRGWVHRSEVARL